MFPKVLKHLRIGQHNFKYETRTNLDPPGYHGVTRPALRRVSLRFQQVLKCQKMSEVLVITHITPVAMFTYPFHIILGDLRFGIRVSIFNPKMFD